ncbi:MAG: glycosyltransferase family 4 protein [Ignavibacteria bacterium]
MKILYDYEIFCLQKYGGVSRYFYELVSRLLKFPGVEIILYMGKFINQYGLEKFNLQYCDFFGEKVNYPPKTKPFFVKFQKYLFEKFRAKTNYNVFHQTYFRPYQTHHNEVRVITVHDFTHERYPQYFSFFDRTIKNKKKAIDTAHGIICVSNATKDDLLKFYPDVKGEIKVIYHGNSLNVQVDKEPFLKHPYFLFVGSRKGYKNFALLLYALALLPELRNDYKIVCFGGGSFNKTEARLIRKLSLEPNVVQIEGNDVMLANAYSFASALVYPSLYEGFGIPLVEAMNYGCPLIVSNSSCFPEITQDAGLYFDPLSPEDLADKMKIVANDSTFRNELKEKVVQRGHYFSWDKCAQETYEFYKMLSEEFNK